MVDYSKPLFNYSFEDLVNGLKEAFPQLAANATAAGANGSSADGPTIKGRVLYSLPEDRFLVLFLKPVGLDDFLNALSGFRREVDSDEDAVGFYGNARYASRSDSLQAYVSDRSGTFRTIPLDLDSVSLSGAEPL